MPYNNLDYKPNAKSRAIIEKAWAHVQSIDYPASSRWLFYRLKDVDHIYTNKQQYKSNFIPLFSRVRRNYYQGWTPETLVDDRRNPIEHKGGSINVKTWASSMSMGGWFCTLDHFYRQQNYTEVWYEAEAMSNQFKHYVKGVTLRPFSGAPSLDYKYSIAKDLEKMEERYGLPIKILYFGDYDVAGHNIPKVAVEDIRKWSNADFEFIRCGLNADDVENYRLSTSVEDEGDNIYQWEALPDERAAELITSSVDEYIDQSLIDECIKEGWKAAKLFDKYVAGFSAYYEENK